MDALSIPEVDLLILKWLEGGPYRDAAIALRKDLENRANFSRLDFQGAKHNLDLNGLLARYPNINSGTLDGVFKILSEHLNKHLPPSINVTKSYLGAGQFSLLRTHKSLHDSDVQHSIKSLMSDRLFGPAYKKHSINMVSHLQARRARGPFPIRRSFPTEIYSRFNLYKKLMGHLSAVYCVCFDQTGQYIITGADDHLVKIWSAQNGRLLKTLRGHCGEITDMSVDFDNRLLATGGMDKIIRIWDLKTTKLLCCLSGHLAMVTSVKFCPYNRHGDMRYLVSTSNDGSVIFWGYHVDKFDFKKLQKFRERNRPGGRIMCSSYSTGGSFLACGSSDHYIHVYGFHPCNGPYWIIELDSHRDQVDSIQFCNNGFRFITGSQDGTAIIWKYRKSNWEPLKLDMRLQLDGTLAPVTNDKDKDKNKVLIVQWSRDDRYVITSVTDFSIKVWDSQHGKLVHVLKQHTHDVYLLEAHPFDPRIIVSASHDGMIVIWDIERGKPIKKFLNKAENTEAGQPEQLSAVYDIKFSPDGSMLAATDSYGYLSFYGTGCGDVFKVLPEQMFFHTDYRSVIRDIFHFILDEQTNLAPHLMPKPKLVDMNGNPYPESLQYLVPDPNTEPNVVEPLAEHKGRAIAETIDNHSRQEDDEYLTERNEPMQDDDPMNLDYEEEEEDDTEEDDDDNTVIDSDATEIDEPPSDDNIIIRPNASSALRPRRLTRSSRAMNGTSSDNNNHHHNSNGRRYHSRGPERRCSARLRARKRFRVS